MSPLRQALRSLRRVPWYALTVVGVTALALAFGTTTFAVVDGVLFKPLPYPRSSELYYVSGGFQRGQHSGIAVAPRNLRDWAAAAPDAGMTAFMAGSGGAGNDDLRGWNPVVSLVDEHFFDVLGVQPLIGDFQRQDFESTETVSPAIISYGAWQRVFGGRPDIIGQPVPVPGASGYRIVGVLPRDFLFPAPGRFQPDLLSPLVISAAQRNDLHNRSVYGLARLPPTKPLSEYQARMDASALAEAAEWVPAANEGTPVFTRVGLGPLETFLTGQQRPVFLLVFAAAATLVVLGCVNLSGLMASRVQDRARELAVRQALGAGPRQLAVLLLAESACVTAAGGLLGLALARPLTALTLRLLPDNLGLLKPTVLDWRVVAFVAALNQTPFDDVFSTGFNAAVRLELQGLRGLPSPPAAAPSGRRGKEPVPERAVDETQHVDIDVEHRPAQGIASGRQRHRLQGRRGLTFEAGNHSSGNGHRAATPKGQEHGFRGAVVPRVN